MRSTPILVVAVWLGFAAGVYADVAPEPPPGPPTLQPMPIVLAGGAAALAIVLFGLLLARARGHGALFVVALVAAAAVLAGAAVVSVRTATAWQRHADEKAQYQKTIASWRSNRPIRYPGFDRPPQPPVMKGTITTPTAVAVFAFTPHSGFTHSLSWAALVTRETAN